MPKLEVDESAIQSFATDKGFARWLKVNHAKQSQIFIRIYKKGTGVPSITPAQALDVALCWGWIDGVRKSHDEQSFCSATRRVPHAACGRRSTATTWRA